MPYSEEQINSSSRTWVRGFLRNHKDVQIMVEAGPGPAHDLVAMINEGITLTQYIGLDVTSGYEVRRPQKLPDWVTFMVLEEPYDWPELKAHFVYARHVIEHQPSPYELLKRMAKVSTQYVAHVFFRLPGTDPYHKIQRLNQDFYFNDISASLLEKESAELGLRLVDRRMLVSATTEAPHNELWLWEKE